MKTKNNQIVLLFLTIIAFSCTSKSNPKYFDYGRVINNKYINSFFDLEISLPSDWVIPNNEQNKYIFESGKDKLLGNNKELKKIFDASKIDVTNLLAVYKYDIGNDKQYNPSFIIIAENLRNNNKSAKDYLIHGRELLKQSQLKFEYLDNDFEKKLINGQEFYLMNVTINYSGQIFKSVYYTTIQNGFAISATISFVNDEQKNELEKVINSMIFKN